MKGTTITIKRVNFLQQERHALTYKNMVFLLIGWCLLLVLAYGVQLGRQHLVVREIRAERKVISQLNKQKDQHLEQAAQYYRRRLGGASHSDLRAILENRPRWSRVLRELTQQLPGQVWLDSVKIMLHPSEGFLIEMTGKAKSQRRITNFLMQLESSGKFVETELDKTVRGKGGKDDVWLFRLTTHPVMTAFMQRGGKS